MTITIIILPNPLTYSISSLLRSVKIFFQYLFLIFTTVFLVDVDECAFNMDRCNRSSARCVNTEGSYVCQCMVGYTEDGLHCSGELVSWWL